ncbi:MAG: threonylcarbamoyl-AMP synthase [Gammaproteobacteria bacterium HGW-Gammaproteobacteria-4]|nr:MAG: threonylcarbamoyl-AMP synthase [Gammaproteobacteria bacterium HGW-Gammaproteobacteria-4]
MYHMQGMPLCAKIRHDSAMSERIHLHPLNPQPRQIERAAALLRAGNLGLCPSDAGYALVWRMEARQAEENAVRLRALDTKHPFTVFCTSLTAASRLGRLDDQTFRLLRRLCPGPYTFILPAAAELPRRFKQAKRRAVGVRIPDHPVTRALLEAVGEPLLATTLSLPGHDDLSSHEAETFADRLPWGVGFLLDCGDCEPGPTSVIDCTEAEPSVVRVGYRPLALD